MRWWSWLALAVVACGGDGGTDTGDGNGTDGGGDDDDDVVIDCTELPVYNLDELDCDQTWTAFLAVAAAAGKCNSDHDCTVVEPDCTHWVQATCFVPANDCLTSDIVHDYNAAGTGCIGDDGDVCTCTATPDVQCKDHYCQFVYE